MTCAVRSARIPRASRAHPARIPRALTQPEFGSRNEKSRINEVKFSDSRQGRRMGFSFRTGVSEILNFYRFGEKTVKGERVIFRLFYAVRTRIVVLSRVGYTSLLIVWTPGRSCWSLIALMEASFEILKWLRVCSGQKKAFSIVV